MIQKLKLLEAWGRNPFAELSISEVMWHANKKTKPWVFNSLKLFEKNNLVVKRNKGNINLYRLDLENPLLFQTLQFLEAQNNYNFSQLNVIKEIVGKIPLNTYCLLVFGSYAEGKQTKESDLDICFLLETVGVEKKIKPYFNEVKMNSSVSIDEHYITFNDFIKMLLTEEENLGKQIFREHKIFFNSDIYYRLIKEAYKNGVRP